MSKYIDGTSVDLASFSGDDILVVVEQSGQRDTYATINQLRALLDTLPIVGGTANGVLYLNGSKVATSGSALTFDGTSFGVGTTPTTWKLDVLTAGTAGARITTAEYGQFVVSDGTRGVYIQNYASVGAVGTSTNNPLSFTVNNTEQMRLTSTGLGIGTTNPEAKLDVWGAPSDQIRVRTAASEFYRFGRNNTNGYMDFYGSQSGYQGYTFGGVDGTWMTLDSSGNLGLGVTPSAWTSYKTLQISTGASLASTANQMVLGSNWSFDGSDRYVISDFSTLYIQNSGQHKWYTAPSGTAGNAISFTQAMTLDASGNLGVGETSTSGARLWVNSGATQIIANFNSTAATGGYVRFQSSGTSYGDIGTAAEVVGGSASDFGINARGARNLIFGTNNTERARITSGGELYVGSSSALGGASDRLQVAAPSAARAGVFRNPSASTDTIAAWNSDTSGDNKFVQFYTEASAIIRGLIDYNRAGGLVRYNTTSDYRAKDIVGPVQNPGATIDSLKVYEGVMKGATQSRPMLIAHEAQAVAPYAVSGVKDEVNEDGTPKFQQMDVSSLVPLLLAEIQSLRARLAAAGI